MLHVDNSNDSPSSNAFQWLPGQFDKLSSYHFCKDILWLYTAANGEFLLIYDFYLYSIIFFYSKHLFEN